MAKKYELSEAIKGKFKVVNTDFPCVQLSNKLLDFRTISLEEAENYYLSNPEGYLQKVKK